MLCSRLTANPRQAKYMAKQVMRGDSGVGATDNNPFLQPAKGKSGARTESPEVARGPNPFEMMSYNAVVPDEVSVRACGDGVRMCVWWGRGGGGLSPSLSDRPRRTLFFFGCLFVCLFVHFFTLKHPNLSTLHHTGCARLCAIARSILCRART
jgi:hypothetical protein